MPTSTQVIIDRAAAVLRQGGGRMTVPRRAVIDALAAADDHVTAEQLVTQVQLVAPGVNRSSVYRTLEALSHAGIVRHVHVSQGGTAYHLARPSAEPHLHAQCRECGAVLDLPGNLLEAARAAVLRSDGFELDPAHVALSGTCRACRAGGT